jgi:hypothetical protein
MHCARQILCSKTAIAMLATTSSILALTQTLRLNAATAASIASAPQVEQSLEKMHSMGYDSGYQSAIVDAYLQNPKYLIEENSQGCPVMWKRVELDQANSDLLASSQAQEEQAE